MAAGRPSPVRSGPLSALLGIFRDATLITLAETAQRITAVAGGEEKKKKRGKNPLKRGASPQPHLGAGWRGGRGHRIDGRSGLMASGRFDGYDC